MNKRRTNIILICWLFFFISFSNLLAQKKDGIPPSKAISQLPLSQWMVKDGLISNSLNDILFAPNGYLWISSYNGLMRFDGISFELYDKERIPFLKSNAILESCIGADQKKIWFASQASGIFYYENGTFSSIENLENNLPVSINRIFESSTQTLWIGSYREGLFKVNKDRKTFFKLPEIKEDQINDIKEDHEGNIWVATQNQGIYCYDKQGHWIKQITKQNDLPSNEINVLYSIGETIYCGTTKGLVSITNNSIRIVPFLEKVEINDVISDSYGTFWIATEKGLYKFNEKFGIYEAFTDDEGLPVRQVTSLAFDHEGSLWLTTAKGGLLRIKNGNFVNLGERESLSSDRINIAVEKSANTVYVGTDDGTIDIVTHNKITPLLIKHPKLHKVSIRDIAFPKNGHTLIASYQGLLDIAPNGEEVLYGPNDITWPKYDLRKILIDSKDQIWLACRSAGLLKFENGHITDTYSKENKKLISNYVLSIEEGEDQSILVGTIGGGLSQVFKDGQVRNIPFEGVDIEGLLIFNIHINKEKIYFATNVGIFYKPNDKASARKLAIHQKLSVQTETFFDILEDERGNIWATSNIGVIKLSKIELEKAEQHSDYAMEFTHLDESEGMRSRECTGATASLTTSNGVFWIPTNHGISILNPYDVSQNLITPQIFITDLATDNSFSSFPEIKSLPKKIVPAGNYQIELFFTALSYWAPEKVKFQYKLENFDKGWTTIEHQDRRAKYTNIPPGDYLFKVKASNNNNVWNHEYASLPITIEPLYYQTIWFYILVIFSIAFIIASLFYWRLTIIQKSNSRLKKLNHQLDSFVYSASHDLKAPLASIKGLVTVAKIDPSTDKSIYFDQIEKSMNRMEGFLKEIIDFSRNERTKLETEPIQWNELIEQALNNISYLDNYSSIRKEIQISDGEGFKSDKNRLSVILNNLITNAIKYHDLSKEDPYLLIEISHKATTVTVKVIDNGTGIDEEHVGKLFDMFYRANEATEGSGLGLYIVKEAIEKLKGKIKVDSQVGSGTVFTLEIPSL